MDKTLAREFTKRRFCLAVFAETAATVALFTGFMTGGEWNAATALVLGLYGVAAWKEVN